MNGKIHKASILLLFGGLILVRRQIGPRTNTIIHGAVSQANLSLRRFPMAGCIDPSMNRGLPGVVRPSGMATIRFTT